MLRLKRLIRQSGTTRGALTVSQGFTESSALQSLYMVKGIKKIDSSDITKMANMGVPPPTTPSPSILLFDGQRELIRQ